MNIVLRTSLLFFIGSFFLFGASRVDVPSEYGSEDAEKKLLIALDRTSFKRTLVSQIIDIVGGDNLFIQVVNIRKIDPYSSEEYDAVLLIDGWKEQVRKNVQQWLSTNAGNHVIAVITKRNPTDSRETVRVPVDSITTASRANLVDGLLSDITSRLRTILNP